MLPKISSRAEQFTESVIREMTRLARQYGALNLAQGFPDFPAPEEIKRAAANAILNDLNQYAITWGAKNFRDAICEKVLWYNGVTADPEREVTVCCGATEGMIASLLAIINPGDEVVIFEPFYENYGPDCILSGAIPKFVTLHEPDWHFDQSDLAAAFNNKTKAILINTPNNPTGKVFSRAELAFIAGLCQKWNAVAVTDEIYEHILFDGEKHVTLATLEGMRDRTITVNALSKTFSVTGWRVGYIIAPPPLTGAIRKVHDFLTVGAAAPLQEAGSVAMRLPRNYYQGLARDYQARRDFLLPGLEKAGFVCYAPRGAYYVMTDIRSFGFDTDLEFSRYLVKEIGVAAVPGSSFYQNPSRGRTKIRFNFAKRNETLEAAADRLARISHPAGMRNPG